jgi:phosphoglycerate dehydrogenase-like enzyme
MRRHKRVPSSFRHSDFKQTQRFSWQPFCPSGADMPDNIFPSPYSMISTPPKTMDARHSLQSGTRVLLCFDGYERRIFSSGSLQLPFCTRWSDSNLARGLFAEISEFKPDILVSCWSTPALPPEIIDHPGFTVRYICHLVGSVRSIIPRCFIEKGGIVTNWGGLVAPQVAEHALLLALALLRNAARWRPFIQQRNPLVQENTADKLQTMTLHGKKVGIHGYGVIARSLIKLLAPFECDITVYSEGVPEAVFCRNGIRRAVTLQDLSRTSEVFFECEALTPGSRGSVTEEILAELRDGAVFVNVARGLIVDEPALLREAASGRIRVGLDVIVNEPVNGSSEWFNIPGVIVSPHIGGPTLDRYRQCWEHALANIQNYASGCPVANRIDLDIYDRMT